MMELLQIHAFEVMLCLGAASSQHSRHSQSATDARVASHARLYPVNFVFACTILDTLAALLEYSGGSKERSTACPVVRVWCLIKLVTRFITVIFTRLARRRSGPANGRCSRRRFKGALDSGQCEHLKGQRSRSQLQQVHQGVELT
jgi:hypothetical protein